MSAPLRPQARQLELPLQERRAATKRPRSTFGARVSSAVRDLLPLLILASAVIFVPVLVFEPQGLPRLRSLERDVEQVEAENRAVEREISRLRAQLRLLKDDLGSAEKVARSEFGLIRKSEIVLQVPRAAATTPSP